MTEKPLLEALRGVPTLSDLSDASLQWLIDHGRETRHQAGEVLGKAGDPADALIILLEGELQARAENTAANLPTYIVSAGEISGLLPQSRMKTFSRHIVSALDTRILRIHKDDFDGMLSAIPELGPRLLGLMADRIRDTTRLDIQYEKLAALGKLSAGLAHELNNPAAAALSSASRMPELLNQLRKCDIALTSHHLSPEVWKKIADFEAQAIERASACTALDSLTRSDREEALEHALTEAGIANAWDLTGELVDAGLEAGKLSMIKEEVGSDAMCALLVRLASLMTLYKLASDVQESTSRVSNLIKAIKTYSWMDTVPEREIDIHEGLESTLTILNHKLRGEIRVERQYDPKLPLVCAHGGELNQVWTNLIGNAIDAMLASTGEKVLHIRTFAQIDEVLVDIADTGPGIPEEIQGRIFEPFFTTKPQDQGTGLGLDLVAKIIRKHRGEIHFESKPGSTCFEVRLPVKGSHQTRL